jgi:ParB-like chromosome segregation protein Spo0J
MDLDKVPVDSIIVGRRLRKDLNKVIVKAIAESVDGNRLHYPIIIDGDNNLIDGNHRLEAFKLLGRKEIPVLRVPSGSSILNQMGEIDSNLIRAELTPLERAEHLQIRKYLYEQLHPESTASVIRASTLEVNKGSGDATVASPAKKSAAFTENASEVTGLSRRTIEEDIQIANNLSDRAKEVVKETGMTRGNMLKLARISKDDRVTAEEVVEVLAKHPEISLKRAEEVVRYEEANVDQLLYTIDTNDRIDEDVVTIAKDKDIKMVVDISGVKENENLSNLLIKQGITYIHIPDLVLPSVILTPYTEGFIDDRMLARWVTWFTRGANSTGKGAFDFTADLILGQEKAAIIGPHRDMVADEVKESKVGDFRRVIHL